jgi:hypothetical protein
MRFAVIVACVLAASAARGDATKSPAQRFVEFTAGQQADAIPLENATPPRFAFTASAAAVSPASFEDCATMLSDYATGMRDAVVGTSADGKSTWVATDIEYEFPCGMEGCDKMVAPRVHAAGLMDASGHAIAWHVGVVSLGGKNKWAVKKPGKPIAPPVLATGIDAGAEEPAKLFKASLADPKALAKTISDRKDAVLLGSEAGERYVGGAAMRATLGRWKLGFTVRDGIQAGVAPSKTTAWVAANVDGAKAGDKKVAPYRVLAIYDKKGSEWQLVVLQFSTVSADS